MVTIVVYIPKGGTGKTTITSNLLAGLNFCYPNTKALALDLSPEGHLTYLLHENPDMVNSEKSVCRLFLDEHYKESDLCQPSRLEHVDIVPSTLYLGELNLNSKLSSNHFIIKEFLARVKCKYDFVLIDSPTVFTFYLLNGLVAADYLLIPSLLTPMSSHAIHDMLALYENVKKENSKLKILGILPNRVNKKLDYQKEILDTLKTSSFKGKLLDEMSISEDKAVLKAVAKRKTIFEMNGKSNSQREFKKLTDWLFGQCVGTTP